MKFFNLLLFLTGSIVFFSSCSTNDSRLFTLMDESKTGINFRNTIFEDGPLNVANYIYFYNGSGVAIGDINNDGLPDIFFTGNMVKNRLYLNKGDFQFENITDKAGIAEKQGWCTGATMVDINGDGRLDIYICRSADKDSTRRENLLYINNGDLTFTEKAKEYGLADNGYSTQAAFFDYDKDGDLDCFVINHSVTKYTAGIQENAELRKEYNADYASKLYRNDNGHFTNVSVEAGIISNVFTFGLGLAVTDINNDGWPDIYVSNDFNEPDYLFINKRNGTFRESLAECMNEVSMYSMGSDAADFNNDGFVDITTLDMLAEDNKTVKMHSGNENFDKFQLLFNKGFYYQYSRNMLQKNNGNGTFSEIGQIAGVSNTDWSWSALFCDYDNDGYKDLFVSNGYVKDYSDMDFMKYSMARLVREMHGEQVDAITEYIRKMPTHEISNYIFQNTGEEKFIKKTKEWGLDKPGVSSGAAYADLDNDGDMDLVVCNTNDFAGIYKNNSEQVSGNNYLKIKLNGGEKNKNGNGSKVTIYCKGNRYYQEQMPVRGFQSSVDPVLNFGLGKFTIADSVIVIWPDDRMQILKNINANQVVNIDVKEASLKWTYDSTINNSRYFKESTSPPFFVHKENTFNDFTVQSLLPNYLSRQGPCIAKADVDKDGLEDIFLGGAKDQPGQLFIQRQDGRFASKPELPFVADAAHEDVAAEFFDADGDGDMDLYVASGGYEFSENDPLLQDRLYINDGKGNFVKKENALPVINISKSCVKPADIDGDGDIDLFIGGRLVPGKYPVSPASTILINDGKGNYKDATAEWAPSLRNAGMVTDAAWIDLNKDKLPDLILVGEWMPIKVLLNEKGKLKDASSNYIHFASSGWWNRIYADDFDGDGDTDIVVGNLGLNTQLKASGKEPLTLYYKDFDGNGSVDPVLCYYVQGVSYPFNSRDDL
ncbi:MAG: VCBS repeat-containing protein, partial [Bacteroidetes bacterium]|nr:VCBS repeat-containing protein [Bacteroidota bacterium]